MKKTAFNISCKTVALLASIPAFAVQPNEEKQRPNIIVIVADDMGYSDFGCYGNTFHKTPNIDRLAEKGMKFIDFHSNGAVSSPTRAALMTGRYQQYSGIEGVITAANHRDVGLPENTRTLASVLKTKDYKTAIFGKWHLGYQTKFNPIHFGFDEFIGYVSGNVDYFSHIDQAGYKDWWHNDSLTEEKGYTTDLITDYAVKYIENNKDSLFFLYLPYEACHYPLQGPGDQALRKVTINGQIEKTDARPRKDTDQCYKEMAEALDSNIGRVLQAVEENHIENNTLIFFFSDNGGAKESRNAPWRGRKDDLYEGGHRVASIACWPGRIAPGQVSEETVMTMDLLPTICEIAGIRIHKKDIDGTSCLNTLSGKKGIRDRIIFWRFEKNVCARMGDWKLLIDRKSRKGTLVNQKTDPQEKRNEWEKYPSIVHKMQKAIDQWEKEFENITQKS